MSHKQRYHRSRKSGYECWTELEAMITPCQRNGGLAKTASLLISEITTPQLDSCSTFTCRLPQAAHSLTLPLPSLFTLQIPPSLTLMDAPDHHPCETNPDLAIEEYTTHIQFFCHPSVFLFNLLPTPQPPTCIVHPILSWLPLVVSDSDGTSAQRSSTQVHLVG